MTEDFLQLGQSGFKIQALEEGGKLVIRKESPGGDQVLIDRLFYQYEKHRNALTQQVMSPLLVPEIRSQFEKNGYSMQHVPGVPLGSAIQLMSRSEILEVGQNIVNYFLGSLARSGRDSIGNLALQKLGQLREVYSQSEDPVMRAIGSEALSRLAIFFDDEDIPTSPNHGDFSFENILYDRRGSALFAIDFLDSPFESVLIDVGRLWLDLRMGWWAQRSAPGAVALVNMTILRDMLRAQLAKHGVRHQQIENFAGFAALRILPYTRQPFRKALLKNALRITGGVI